MLLKFTSEDEWLEARKHDITSTDMAALFGLHPYKSRFQLWHEKAGNIGIDFEESDLTRWGRRLQIPVGMGICEDQGWQGQDLTGIYSRSPIHKNGSSFDVKVISRKLGAGVMEVKIAESFNEENGWTKDAAPIMYEFQLATQLHRLAEDDPEIKFGAIGTLGRRQRTRLYFREYDRDLGDMMNDECDKFWQSIKVDQPPAPDYVVDGALLERLRKPIRSGDVIVLTGNNRAHELIETFREKQAQRAALLSQVKPIEAECDAIKSEIYEMMGRNEKAIIGPYQVSAKQQVVEEFINHGSSFRRFDVSKKGK